MHFGQRCLPENFPPTAGFSRRVWSSHGQTTPKRCLCLSPDYEESKDNLIHEVGWGESKLPLTNRARACIFSYLKILLFWIHISEITTVSLSDLVFTLHRPLEKYYLYRLAKLYSFLSCHQVIYWCLIFRVFLQHEFTPTETTVLKWILVIF